MGIIFSIINPESSKHKSLISTVDMKLDDVILKNLFIVFYSIAKVYDKNIMNSLIVKRFLYSSVVLSRNETLKQEYEKLPVDEFLKDSSMLFLWVFLLHSKLVHNIQSNNTILTFQHLQNREHLQNTPITFSSEDIKTILFNIDEEYKLPYTLMDEMFSLKNFNSNTWSHAFWNLIHYFGLQVNYNKNIKNHYYNFLQSLSIVLPCPVCRSHIADFKFDFKNVDDFFDYSVKLHNNVNKQLEHPQFDIEEAKLKYQLK
jgi:hypothetical protein